MLRGGKGAARSRRRGNAGAAVGPKPSFPADNVAQTAAVMAALASASGPLSSAALAAGFRRARQITPQIEAVLGSLLRMGYAFTADGGRTFALRRAA